MPLFSSDMRYWLSRKKYTFGWKVPRRAGTYTVVLSATDLAGNTASDTTTVRVLKPKKKKRP